MKPATRLLFSALLLTGCAQQPEASAPETAALTGRWQYDSVGATIYHGREFSNRFTNSLPGAVLTVGATNWEYSGTVREQHSYTRHGRTLLVSRNGRTDTLRLLVLTPHRLLLQDSSVEPGGSLVKVWRQYYSR